MKKSILPLLIFLFFFISCSENPTNKRIIDTVGAAHYYINNQSNIDINVVFTTTVELGSKTDSSTTISSGNSELIFKDGIIGVNPKPSDSFSKIEIYTSSNKSVPALIIDPIKNKKWKIIGKKSGDVGGLRLTKYQLTITNSRLE